MHQSRRARLAEHASPPSLFARAHLCKKSSMETLPVPSGSRSSNQPWADSGVISSTAAPRVTSSQLRAPDPSASRALNRATAASLNSSRRRSRRASLCMAKPSVSVASTYPSWSRARDSYDLGGTPPGAWVEQGRALSGSTQRDEETRTRACFKNEDPRARVFAMKPQNVGHAPNEDKAVMVGGG